MTADRKRFSAIIIFVIFVILGLALVVNLLNPEVTKAQIPPPPPSPYNQGYFTAQNSGGRDLSEGTVLSTGLLNIRVPSSDANVGPLSMNTANWAFTLTDKDAFINFIKNKLYSSSPIGGSRDSIGAAFIIQTMRGISSPNGEANYPTAAEVTDWENKIRQSSVSLRVVGVYLATINSAYMDRTTETTTRYPQTKCLGWFGEPHNAANCASRPIYPTGYSPGACIKDHTIGDNLIWKCTAVTNYAEINDDMFFSQNSSLPSLVFSQNGIDKVAIKINCGNLLGSVGLDYISSNNWDYNIDLKSSPATTTTWLGGRPLVTVTRGQTVDLISTVTNTGSDTGLDYAQIIRPINNSSNDKATIDLTKLDAIADTGHIYTGTYPVSMGYKWDPLGGLGGGGSSRIMTGHYQVKNTATPGDVICFYGRVAPASPSIAYKDTPVTGQVCIQVQDSSPPVVPPPGTASCNSNTLTIVSTPGGCSKPASSYGPSLAPGETCVSGTYYTHVIPGSDPTGSGVSCSGSAQVTALSSWQSTIASVVLTIKKADGTTYGQTVWTDTIGPCAWQYWHGSILLDAGSSTFPKPGDDITIDYGVVNPSAGPGPSYINCLYPDLSDGTTDNLVDDSAKSWTASGLPGDSGPLTYLPYSWQVETNVANNTPLCFHVEHAPQSGPSMPLIDVDDATTNESPVRCWTVFNERFDFRDPGTLVFEGASSSGTTAFSPGEDVTLKTTFENSDLPGIQSYNAVHSFAPAGKLEMEITNVSGPAKMKSGSSKVSNSTDIDPNDQFSSGNSLVVTVDSDAQIGQQVCVTVTLTPDSGYSDSADVQPVGSDTTGGSTTHCFTVKDGPYLKVYGNDVWAGVAFKDSSGNCTAGAGDIRALTRTTSSTTVGAAVEYAAYASGLISGFGTANKASEISLTFANTPSLGDFKADSNAKCVPDYFSLLKANANPLGSVNAINTVVDGQYLVKGSGTLNNINKFGGRKTVLVDGDLTITDNITYDSDGKKSYGTGDNPKVPILVFVVKGNINIENKVTRLDGIYISLKNDSLPPGSDKSGIINTCSDGIDGPALSINSCDNPLEIYGSFIAADTVRFRRTSGGTNEAATGLNLVRCTNTTFETGGDNEEKCAAEIFRFSPEAYLADPIFDVGGTDPNNLEIQLIKDLPPIF